jgi:hypothetical protein
LAANPIILDKTALQQRFLPSTTPYSSMETPLHASSSSSSSTATAPSMNHNDRPLEIPTPESILGGYEECDDLDPNASAVVYRYCFRHESLVGRLAIDCRTFHFLGSSARCLSTATDHTPDQLLFQYDVHGLVFHIVINKYQKDHSISLVHAHTFPALAYVQASKNQKKFLQFHPSGSWAVLAEFEKRVWLYRGHPDSNNTALDKGQHVHSQVLDELEAAENKTILGLQFVSPTSILVLTKSHLVHLSVAFTG